MQIGKLNVDSRAFLAPMAEVTDFAFRKIARDYGCGLTFTQMVSADGVVKNNFETLRLFSFSRNEKPIGVQLLGNDPMILGAAVSSLVRHKPDVIDLNCGCPVDKVLVAKWARIFFRSRMFLEILLSKWLRILKGFQFLLR
ncbi:MAG: tRNA-dihydrouridine synthase family protein [Ignavibacteriales bacterium]|nr:tRNA-dihydrouridine synthase family protein [Ignavibacteriales bacterium]